MDRDLVDDVLAGLATVHAGRIPVIEAVVPARPGLYAVTGPPWVWRDLGLGEPPDERPLYIGKAERSLASRDVRTHFATGATGSSTLRRSLAALLAEALDLEARPRNPSRPSYFANFALQGDGEARLTSWMRTHLLLSVWAAPTGMPPAALNSLETEVLQRLMPPLNLAKVATPWRPLLLAGRATLARQARAYPSPS